MQFTRSGHQDVTVIGLCYINIIFWNGEEKRYLKIQLIELLIRHFACSHMISKLSFTEQLSVRLLLVSIICGIFRYSTVPFLKLRAHTLFIRWKIELYCFEKGPHELFCSRAFCKLQRTQATKNTGKKL